MRLIDADNLTELCDIMADKCDGIGEGVWHQFKTTIEWSPTIDVVPIRHGKWIDKSGGIEGAWDYCSVCGERAIDLYDYCPNCGAKMDEDDETDLSEVIR